MLETDLKLGIVIQHYDARNDIRELVDLLAREHEIVLFGAAEKLCDIPAACSKRAFRQRLRLTDRFWLQAWNLVGELPASRNNFLVAERFKLAPLPPVRRAIAAARLRLRLRLPSLMSFDFLLDRLAGSDTTPVEDIDRFLVITELSSPRFLSTVLRSGKPVDAYVYSWDHACKHATFSKRIDRWLVWHEGIADDLVELQGLPRERIHVVGATQLAYIHEYLSRAELRERRHPGRYIYYGCGVGTIETARQEARLIRFLAEILGQVAPDVTLLVRPYPMLAETEFFRALREQPNVRFDEDYRRERKDRSLTRDAIFERLNLQEHAAAFVHCGTTMGLEGSYLGVPVIFLDLRDFDYGVKADAYLGLGRFIHQYHNERYMIRENCPSVVTSSARLAPALKDLLEGVADWTTYNKAIAGRMPLKSLEDVARRMLDLPT